jgi:N utilization substance protein A
MNKEILLVADAVSNEKGVDKDIIFQAIEAALATAARKKHGMEMDIRVEIDRDTGDYESFRRWEVLDDEDPEFESNERQILYSYAIQDHPDIQVGEFIEEPIESVEFGRISAHTAKQVIVQKIREAERSQIVEIFQDRVGELVMGVVKRTDHSGTYIDLGNNAEGLIPRDQMIPREAMRPGDRVRAFLHEVREETRGPQLFLTRTAPEFLIELFKLEVPEVGQGLIEVLSAARDPGLRAKIAVKSNDPRLDPVGACVGMRGSRVQSVSNELAGERIDIILWDENPAQYVINAMSPAAVTSIVVDEDKQSMDIAVEDEKLSQAIGRGGQNVKLASQLTGWELNVMTEGQAEEKSEAETRQIVEMFMSQLDVDEEVAVILAQEGFSSVEEVAYVPPKELIEVEEFDEEIVEELRARARDVLLTKALVTEEKFTDAEPSADLLNMEGMDKDLAFELACRGISTMEDLAEQSVDELLEIEGLDSDRAGALIMAARAPWFENEGATS